MNNQNQKHTHVGQPNQPGVITHIGFNNGTLNFSRYLDPAMTPPDGYQTFSYTGNEDGNQAISSLQNHAEIPLRNNPTPMFATTSKNNDNINVDKIQNDCESNNEQDAPSNFKTANGNNITPQIRKRPYQVPLSNTTSLVTPHQATDHVSINGLSTAENLETTNHNTATIPSPVDQGFQIHSSNPSLLPKTINPMIYDSAFLNKKFKPKPNELLLEPEIEPLRPLILSQHEAFTQTIKDLGITSIMLTKIIENKKESCLQLTENNKTPRSLRLKCALTTSPSYADNQEFLRLREKLHDKTEAYIKEGTAIMAEWATINIQLLSEDRCHDTLIKALKILEGLVSYSADIIGTPNWPSTKNDNITPLLLKFYMSGKIFDITSLLNYFELTAEKILQIGIKILLKYDSNEKITEIINSLNVNDVDMTDELHNTFVKETLTNFNQVMHFTTSYIWEHYKQQIKQDMAAEKVKTKMKAAEIKTATESTAFAIAKATNDIKADQELSLSSSLRIANLEKSMKRQEQQTNELYNRTKRAKTQKNSNGSQQPESLASPNSETPYKNKNKELASKISSGIVDLTTDNITETNQKSSRSVFLQNSTKQKKLQDGRKNSKTKNIKWKTNEMLTFNPETPAGSQNQNPFLKSPHQTPPTGNMLYGPPLFHPSQLPSHPFYTNPIQYTTAIPFGQSPIASFNMGTQTNTHPYPQTPVHTQYLQIPNQQTQYLQMPNQPNQQNPNSKANPFKNPFLQSK